MNKKKVFESIILSFSLIALSACGHNESQNKNKISLNVEDNLTTLDPTLNATALGSQQINNTMEGLYKYEGKKLKPAGATSIAKPSKDGKKYIINLRKTKWSNGDSVTAKDYVYSWQRAVDPKTGSQYTYMFDSIKNAKQIVEGKKDKSTLGIKALNDYKLEINLDNPVTYFSSLLTNMHFVPLNKEAVTKAKGKYGLTSNNTVVNGAYVMKNWKVSDTSWKQYKNKNYWDKKNVKTNELEYQVVKDPNTGLNLYSNGDLDIYKDLSGDSAKQLSNRKDFSTIPTYRQLFLMLNHKKESLFANKNIRQAISHSIDRKQLADKVLGNTVMPADSVVSKNLIFNEKTKTDFTREKSSIEDRKYTKFNPKLAKGLWKKGLKETNHKKVTLNLLSDDTDTAKKTTEYLQSSFNQYLPGLKIELSNVPFKNRVQKSFAGDFNILISSWTPSYADPSNFLDLFMKNNSLNFGGWNNNEYNKEELASATKNANDYDKRWNNMLKAQHIITEEQGVIPLYQNSIAKLTKKGIKDFNQTPNGYFDMSKVYKD